MAESPRHNEGDTRKPPVAVAIDNFRMGHLIKEEGESFDLKNLFGDRGQIGGDAFEKVYFRTDSGNIYQLDKTGRLINGRQSGVENQVDAIQLDKKALEDAKITVGTSFRFEQGNTTRITEIVPTNDRLYQPDYQQSATRGMTSTIYSDFIKMIPPEYADEVQSLRKPYIPLPDGVIETQNPSLVHRIFQRFKRH
jgi:hypothetical protein